MHRTSALESRVPVLRTWLTAMYGHIDCDSGKSRLQHAMTAQLDGRDLHYLHNAAPKPFSKPGSRVLCSNKQGQEPLLSIIMQADTAHSSLCQHKAAQGD